MADQQQVPTHTSSLAFEQYAASKPVRSSVDLGWQNLIVRTYQDPPFGESLIVPALADPHIVVQLNNSTRVEFRESDSAWESVQIQPRQLFITPPSDRPCELRWSSKFCVPVETVHLHLDAHLLTKVGLEVAEVDVDLMNFSERSGIHDPIIEQTCLMLKQELEQGGLGSRLYVESTAQILAVHLLRQYCSFKHRVQPCRGLSQTQLRRVIDYINDHLDTDVSLNDLAQQAGFSDYHFARLFKQSTGESPHHYVTRQRIKTAQRLLKETASGVVDIALAVGYHSPSHFATQFKRLTGTSPTAFRQKC